MKVSFISEYILFWCDFIKIIIEKYWINPQYLLIITDFDIVDKETGGTLSIIVSLMQKEYRKLRLKSNRSTDMVENYIQFRIYRVNVCPFKKTNDSVQIFLFLLNLRSIIRRLCWNRFQRVNK